MWLNIQSSRCRYHPWTFAKYEPALIAGGGGKRAVRVGMIVCATRSEASIATTIGTATWTMKIEISLSLPKMIGRNTMTVESVPASTARPTSLTPDSVEASASAPGTWRWRKMLSVTTTALSTSSPIASSMPIIVRMLSEKPRKYIAATVISSENGTASPTISVVGQSRRNRNSTISARPAPMRPAFRRSLREVRMFSDWFCRTMISMPCSCGSLRCSSTTVITRSATSTMFAPVDLNTSRPTPGRPFRCRPTVRSGVTMLTSAMSCRRTLPVTMKLRTSSIVRNSPIGRTRKRCAPPVTSPALTEKFAPSSESRRRAMSTP